MSKYQLKRRVPIWLQIILVLLGIAGAIVLGILIYGGCVGVTFPEAAKICLPFLFKK